jgi:hypothetical protein
MDPRSKIETHELPRSLRFLMRNGRLARLGRHDDPAAAAAGEPDDLFAPLTDEAPDGAESAAKNAPKR